ncbi:MAG TPA: glycosyl hydrolase [Verrucomicrobiota bacterium]|nr:glycosyl hydrolase [Verrucomicrobiota bacterium]HQL79566.1 glycosyl hydrolase [Verrucomicrobiota bacterium]
MTKHRLAGILLLAALTVSTFTPAGAELQRAFESPPESAKPLTWWHWIDGNVTKSGITGDLEAMKRAGLGGCYLFSIGGFFPEGPAKFRQEQWYELLGHTVKEAERLGLVFGVHNCDGWSEAGGPWITPETSMKELTHASVDATGPSRFAAALPAPPRKEDFYRDIAVVAFRLPAGERVNGPASGTRVTGSLGASALEVLGDGQLRPRAEFPESGTGHRIEFDLGASRLLRTMILHNVSGYVQDEDFPTLVEASADGKAWRPAGKFCFSWDTADGAKPITVALGELNTRFLRLSFTNLWPVQIGEVELSSAAKLHFAEAKAGWLRCRGHGGEARNYARYPGPDRHLAPPADYRVYRTNVLDLTAKLGPDGRLDWEVPPGHWRILRVGYTSNGRSNKPATPAGRGLECDKLDAKVVRAHLDQYVGQLVQRFGPAVGKTFAAVETDSWECDVQNWTAGLEQRLKQRTGIEIAPWLPLLLEGWVVDSPDASERMLWDWRRFLADQFAESFFGQVGRYLREKGLTYVSEGSGRQMYLYDPIGYQRSGDVPMGEFWLNTGAGQGVRVDNKVAASTAHITGKRIVASESYTASAPFAKWQNHPYSLKPLGDRAYCAGVNQFVFHTFAHQPYEVTGPGITMAVWGLNCNRANTWWEPGRAWMRYLARCNHLLQEGGFVADVLWSIGEDVPNRIGWRDELTPPLPPGYDFDGCDATALLQAKVESGRIVLPSGMSYRVLLLANRPTMRPAVLRKVAELVRAGAVIVGPAPQQSPSLADIGRGDEEVRNLGQQIWGPCDGVTVKDHAAGKGHVYWGLSFPEVFNRLGLAPDFAWEARSADAEVFYIHRRIGDAEVFFVSNQKPRTEPITAKFRVANRQPELWDPVTGTVTQPAVFKAVTGGVEMGLSLDPAGSVFVVFREPMPARHAVAASGRAELAFEADGRMLARVWQPGVNQVEFSDGSRRELPGQAVPPPIELAGPWDVQFPPGLGAPPSARFSELVSWTQRPEAGIRYFSGTAPYTLAFEVSAENLGPGREAWFDLGDVQVIAEVRLNGQDLGILWKPPFRLNATAALKPGTNRLEVRVTNLWPNRMIGDEQLPDPTRWGRRNLIGRWPDWVLQGEPRPDGRVTFCTRKVYTKDDPLLPSGLLGPVRLIFAQTVKL